LFFSKPPIAAEVVPQVAPIQQIHQQVQVLAVLKGIVHVHQKWTAQLRKDLSLVHYRLHTPLRNNSGLRHLFHSVDLLSLFAFNFPNFAEAAFANAVLVLKVGLRLSYKR
jgi:hypothetical protein